MSYWTLRSQLNTGDLFFLHGTSPAGVLIQQLEKLEGWPPYSHIGMVVKDGDNLYLWDAPGGGKCFDDPYVADSDNRVRMQGGDRVHTGCRVSVLDDVLAYYVTKVDINGFWVRQVRPSVTRDQFAALRKFVNRVDGLPFPPKSELVSDYLFGQNKVSLFFGTYFCSQLVADSYMHMGLLEMEVLPPNGYSPAAFAMNDPDRLRLVPPATLGDVVFADWGNGPKSGGTKVRNRAVAPNATSNAPLPILSRRPTLPPPARSSRGLIE